MRSELPPDMSKDAEVRAPLPVVRDRLYGVDLARLGRPRGVPNRERNQVDAFRDFRCAVAVGKEHQLSMTASLATVMSSHFISSLHSQRHALYYSKLLCAVCGT